MIPSLHALQYLVSILDKNSTAIIPVGKVSTSEPGTSEPGTVDILPCLSVSAADMKETVIGIGGVLLVQNTVEGGLRKVLGDRARMTLCIDIWATSTPLIEEISQKLTNLFLPAKLNCVVPDFYV